MLRGQEEIEMTKTTEQKLAIAIAALERAKRDLEALKNDYNCKIDPAFAYDRVAKALTEIN